DTTDRPDTNGGPVPNGTTNPNSKPAPAGTTNPDDKPHPDSKRNPDSRANPSDEPKSGDRSGARSGSDPKTGATAGPAVMALGVAARNTGASGAGPRPPWWRRTWPLRRAATTGAVGQLKDPTGTSPTDGTGAEPADRWAAFAPAPEPAPGRLSRVTRI